MSAEPSAKKSYASRYLFLFLLGLVVGAVAAFMALRALHERQDPFPHSVMHVMGKHAGLLAETIKQNRCAATNTFPHVNAMRVVADDIELAFPALAEDQRFVQHASDLRGRLDAAKAAPPTDCAGASALLAQVKESCNACHQEFNN
jgi:cytochrome c556